MEVDNIVNKGLALLDKYGGLDANFELEEDDEEDLVNNLTLQSENVYNRLLPYDTSVECQEHLTRIKEYLTKSIQLDQETCLEWLIELERFISIYGLAFSKEDHLKFIHLLYEMLMMPNKQDLSSVSFVARLLTTLLKKRSLISRNELTIPWRPLYELYERLLFSNTESLGMLYIPNNLEGSLKSLICVARAYFSVDSTAEMLDEWRPLLCPYDSAIRKATNYLGFFLPTLLPPEDHDKGFKLWFDEIMDMWLNCRMVSVYEQRFTMLLSRLSHDSLGYIDWEPYIPAIFTHIKIGFNLSGSARPSARRHCDSVEYITQRALWIVSMIFNGGRCQSHINNLFKAIESFYHPSNYDGRWHKALQQFLYKLPACFVRRIYRERYKKSQWTPVPEKYRLTDDDISQFVDSIKSVLFTSMFNQSILSCHISANVCKDLAILRPEKIIPPLLERLYGSYQTLVEPHRILASINCMASVAHALVRPSPHFPEGQSHVVPLLLNSLAGIDFNDMRKCFAVLRFISTLAAFIQMEDFSYLVDEQTLTPEQQELCFSSSKFEEFVIQFLDKCFVVIENSTSANFSNLDQENGVRNRDEGIIEAAISSVTLAILAKSSEKIQQAAIDKIYSHISRHIFDTKTPGKAIASMCLALVKANSKLAVPKFLPHSSKLILTLTDNPEIFEESVLDDELLFSLLLMSEIVRCDSDYLVIYREQILSVLHRALRLNAKEGYKLGCSLLRHSLRTLTNIACFDWKSIPQRNTTSSSLSMPTSATKSSSIASTLNSDTLLTEVSLERGGMDENRPTIITAHQAGRPRGGVVIAERQDEMLMNELDYKSNDAKNNVQISFPFDEWGATIHVDDLKINWHVPKPKAQEFALELCQTFMLKALQDLLDHVSYNKNKTQELDKQDDVEMDHDQQQKESVTQKGQQKEMTRYQIHRSLHVILSTLVGAAAVLEPWDSPKIDLCPVEVPVIPIHIEKVGIDYLKFPNNVNIRTEVAKAMFEVLSHLMSTSQDDTKSLGLVCEIFSVLMTYFGTSKTEYRTASERVSLLRRGMDNKLLGSKRHIRLVLAERVVLQHRNMMYNRESPVYTQLHQHVFEQIFLLATSHYSDVRMIAQDTIHSLLQVYPHFEILLVPKLSSALREPNIEHNKLKGLLYIIYGKRSCSSVMIDPNWTYLNMLWPAIIESHHSEKTSIVRLLDRLCEIAQKSFNTFELEFGFHENVKKHARNFGACQAISEQDLQFCKQKSLERNRSRVENYTQLVKKLVALVDSPQLHWHRRMMAFTLLSLLVRDDIQAPLSAVHLFVQSLISERLAMRKKAFELLSAQLKLLKRPHLKIELKEVPKDNKWMQYRLTSEPYTPEEWDKLTFVDHPEIGYYCWPKPFKVYAPYDQQPRVDRARSELNEYELSIYDRFINDEHFIAKLCEYCTLEDDKKTDRFDCKRFIMFKGLFRNFGPCMIEPFRKYVNEFISSKCEYKQRFAIEFLAGLIRGSKHWSYDMLTQLREYVLPLLASAPLSQENLIDWINFVNYVFKNRDIKRLEWLMYYLIKRAVFDVQIETNITPFVQSARLTLANMAISQCEWRATDNIFPIVFNELKKQNQLLSYANIRSQLVTIYSIIFSFDYPAARTMIPGTLDGGPKRCEFFDFLLPRLAILEATDSSSSNNCISKQNAESSSSSEGGVSSTSLDGAGTSVESKTSVINVIENAKSALEKLKFQARSSPIDLADITNAASSILPSSLATSEVSDAVSEIADMVTDDNQTKNNDLELGSRREGTRERVKLSKLERIQTAENLERQLELLQSMTSLGKSPDTHPDVAAQLKQLCIGFQNANGIDIIGSQENQALLSSKPSELTTNTNQKGEDSEEREEAKKLMKLTCTYVIFDVCRMLSSVPPEFFKLFPVICDMGRETKDPELFNESAIAFAVLGSPVLSPEAVDEAIKAVRKIVLYHSWHARSAAAMFLQIMVSSNLFLLLDRPKWIEDISDILINSMICDRRIEVRESSATTLSGLIHYECIKVTNELISEFRRRANSPLVRRKQSNGLSILDPQSIVIRHSGILGFCACVDAHPYTVPEFLPDILTLLSDHLSDPQPISTTIKKTMSNFRRTHHDNWQSDKKQFTDDQLGILADLLVSPSYYA